MNARNLKVQDELTIPFARRSAFRVKTGKVLHFGVVVDLDREAPGKAIFLISVEPGSMIQDVHVENGMVHVGKRAVKWTIDLDPPRVPLEEILGRLNGRFWDFNVANARVGFFVDDEPVVVIPVPVVLSADAIREEGGKYPFYYIEKERDREGRDVPGFHVVARARLGKFVNYLETVAALVGEEGLIPEAGAMSRVASVARKKGWMKSLLFLANLVLMGCLTLWYLLLFTPCQLPGVNPYQFVELFPLPVSFVLLVTFGAAWVQQQLRKLAKDFLEWLPPRNDRNPLGVHVPEKIVMTAGRKLDKVELACFRQAFCKGMDNQEGGARDRDE